MNRFVESGALLVSLGLIAPTASLAESVVKPPEPEVKIQARASTETQGAGTPNISSAGIFAPVKLNKNWILFLDGEIGVNYPDRSDYSSIINTTIGGYTLSTSSRLGTRFLSDDRQWMWGMNAGYDSRPITTGAVDHGSYYVKTGKNLFYEQLGGELEFRHKNAGITAYANVPIGDKVQALNAYFNGGALETYGLDFDYFLNRTTKATLGYYYQQGDLGTANGSGALASLQWQVANGLYLKGTYSYDNAFESRATAGIEYRFGANQDSREYSAPLQTYLEPPGHRLVRIHDAESDNGVFDEIIDWLVQNCTGTTTGKVVCSTAGGLVFVGTAAAIVKYLKSKKAKNVLNDDDSRGSSVFDEKGLTDEEARANYANFIENQRLVNGVPDDVELYDISPTERIKILVEYSKLKKLKLTDQSETQTLIEDGLQENGDLPKVLVQELVEVKYEELSPEGLERFKQAIREDSVSDDGNYDEDDDNGVADDDADGFPDVIEDSL